MKTLPRYLKIGQYLIINQIDLCHLSVANITQSIYYSFTFINALRIVPLLKLMATMALKRGRKDASIFIE